MTSRQRAQLLETIRPRLHSHAQRYPILATAANDLDHAAPHALTAFQRMQDARPGLPGAQAYDAPTVSGGSAGLTQPERLADREDRTEADRRLADSLLNDLDAATNTRGVVMDPDQWCRRITSDALALRRLIEAWTPHAPTDAQRRKVTESNTLATECALTRDALNLWARPIATSNLYGLLPEAVPVSLWVRRFAKDNRRLPTPTEWKRHASQDDDLRSQLIASVR